MPSPQAARPTEVGEPNTTYTPVLPTPRCDVHPGTTYTLRTLQPQPGNNRDARARKVQCNQHRVRDTVKGSGW